MQHKLSIVLATHNEENNLKRCLQAVKSIADEIIIVDGSSTDKTPEIAKSFKAKIIKTTNKLNFHINKQMGIEAAKNEWILLLDADEVVSNPLAKEISEIIQMSQDKLDSRQIEPDKLKLFTRHQQLIENRDGAFSTRPNQTVAFFIPRLNMFLGKPLKHGGVYPDGVIRLIKNGHAKLPAKDVHEQFQVKGKVSWLENDLLHYDSPTFTRYLQRANRYTSFTAQQHKEKNLPINPKNTLYYLIIKPKLTFFNLYFRHKGMLDGFPGFVWCLFSALHHPIAYLKYWELKIKK